MAVDYCSVITNTSGKQNNFVNVEDKISQNCNLFVFKIYTDEKILL